MPHPAQGDEGRLVPLRAQLLPALPARRAHGAADRHVDLPPRLSLRRSPAVSKRRQTARARTRGTVVYADTKRLAIRLPIAVAIALPPAAAILRGTLGRRSARCSGWATARRKRLPRSRPARTRNDRPRRRRATNSAMPPAIIAIRTVADQDQTGPRDRGTAAGCPAPSRRRLLSSRISSPMLAANPIDFTLQLSTSCRRRSCEPLLREPKTSLQLVPAGLQRLADPPLPADARDDRDHRRHEPAHDQARAPTPASPAPARRPPSPAAASR